MTAGTDPATARSGDGSAAARPGDGSTTGRSGDGSAAARPGDGPAARAGDEISRVSSGGPWERRYGYCRAVRAGDRAVTAGCTATVDGAVAHPGDAYGQTATAIRIGLDALAKLGAGPATVVRTRMYVVDIDAHADAVGRAHAAAFGAAPPAATMVQVARLIDPGLLVEIELEAWLGEEG